MPGSGKPGPSPEPAFRVLVADDDEDFRELVVRILQLSGAETIEAKDGVEAIGQWTRYRPEVVLLDGEMAGLDGWSAAVRIRAAERRLSRRPSVLVSISADTSPSDEEVAALGFDHRLPKPFDFRELGNLVELVRSDPCAARRRAPTRTGLQRRPADGPGGPR